MLYVCSSIQSVHFSSVTPIKAQIYTSTDSTWREVNRLCWAPISRNSESQDPIPRNSKDPRFHHQKSERIQNPITINLKSKEFFCMLWDMSASFWLSALHGHCNFFAVYAIKWKKHCTFLIMTCCLISVSIDFEWPPANDFFFKIWKKYFLYNFFF